MLDDDVLSLDISVVAQPLPKRLRIVEGRSIGCRLEEPDSVDLPTCWLRVGGERRKSETESENDREPDQPHGHLVENGWRGV
jgi:hypothetical protein